MKVVHKNRNMYNIYIGRGSVFGNPFIIGKDGDRDTVITKYESYARNNHSLLQFIKDLDKDAILGCFCFPKRCHGNVIIKLWEELHAKD